jgi:hypothetical protein
MKNETTTKLGRCRDCAQGLITPAAAGFQLQMDGDEPLFWYCLYCGSNHVDILDAEGNVILSQDDLYAP